MGAERDPAERRAAAALDLAAAGRRDARIEIVDYDDGWPRRFAAEAARLLAIVPELELHHIGSTAVAAKPIIDVMGVVESLDAPLPALTERGGYEYPAAYNALLVGRRWLCRPSAAHRTHHLHLVEDPDELARHLRFSDALRADPRLARRYAALKRALAARMPDDREGYTAAKTGFIERAEAAFGG
ncbi:MAG: GrpB family protein [Solirubrobacteraceae bacterium]